MAAADTFRAAAIDQLKTWANRAGVDIIAQNEGADPSAVVYDAVAAKKKPEYRYPADRYSWTSAQQEELDG